MPRGSSTRSQTCLLSGPATRDEAVAAEEDGASDISAWNTASMHVSSLGPVFCAEGGQTARARLGPAPQIARGGVHDRLLGKEEVRQRKIERGDTARSHGWGSLSLPELGYEVRCLMLCLDERMAHFHTANRRCEGMLMRGLLRKTAELGALGGFPDGSQVSRAIEYRQALGYISGGGMRGGTIASPLRCSRTSSRRRRGSTRRSRCSGSGEMPSLHSFPCIYGAR